jgi:flagellar assembly factor FliW
MKVLPDSTPTDFVNPVSNNFELPQGLIGFKDYHRAELLYVPDHLPFLWMKIYGADEPVHFIVIEPGDLIPDYELEIFDEDAASVGLRDASDAMILNIVTLRQQDPIEATVNLIGPIIVNRRTRSAKQLVLANYSRYSAHHLLVDNHAAAAPTAARATA